MTYKFNIQSVDLTDLNGTDFRELFKKEQNLSFEKTIGNLIYTQSEDIDIADKARDIHKGNEVIITEREKPMFEDLINKCNLAPFIKRQIIKQLINNED